MSTPFYSDNSTFHTEEWHDLSTLGLDDLILGTPKKNPGVKDWYKWSLLLVYTAVVLGLPLNLVTIVAYFKSGLSSKGKPAHHFMFNLIVSDLISLLSCQPFLIFNYFDVGIEFIKGKKVLCISSVIGMILVWDSSRLAVLLLTAERLFAIASPLHHMHKMTKSMAVKIIVLTWVAMLFKGSITYFWNDWTPKTAKCTGVMIFKKNYTSYIHNPFVYGSTGLICILNVVLLLKAIGAIRRIPNQPSNQTTLEAESKAKERSQESEMKLIKVILILVVVMFVTWVPFHLICYLMAAARPGIPARSLQISYHMSRAFTLFSSVVDPIIYFSQDCRCRDAVKNLMGIREESSKNHTPQTPLNKSSNSQQSDHA